MVTTCETCAYREVAEEAYPCCACSTPSEDTLPSYWVSADEITTDQEDITE